VSEFRITCSIAKAYERQDGAVIRKFIGGLASGTQVDLEGERMAETAIQAFQRAIKSGMTLSDGQWSLIPLRSGHRHEWDDVLGWITGADVDAEHNLWIEAELDQENPVAMGLFKKLTRPPELGKPLKLGLSVGGSVVSAGYESDDLTGSMTKVYYDVDLREVSVVSQPAYPTSYLFALSKSVDWDALTTDVTKADTYKPTGGMKSAAKRALAWKDDGRAGGTRIGLTRANQIVNGDNLSLSTVKRMYSFFSRHEVDKQADGFSEGEDGYPSPGRVAWDLWGGDAGFSWSTKIVNSLDDAEKSALLESDNELDELLDELEVNKEKTQMEEVVKTEEILTEELTTTDAQSTEVAAVEKAEAETQTEAAVEVEKLEHDEESASDDVEDDVEEDVIKSQLANLDTRVAALGDTVMKLTEQLTVIQEALMKSAEAVVAEEAGEEQVGKSLERGADCTCGGQCDGSCLTANIIKSAVLAAIEPVIERLDRLESEPVDKSYAVMKNKYDDLPFEQKAAREINEMDGREAIRKALELAFKGM